MDEERRGQGDDTCRAGDAAENTDQKSAAGARSDGAGKSGSWDQRAMAGNRDPGEQCAGTMGTGWGIDDTGTGDRESAGAAGSTRRRRWAVMQPWSLCKTTRKGCSSTGTTARTIKIFTTSPSRARASTDHPPSFYLPLFGQTLTLTVHLMHDDDHPLLLELTSLRQTAARFQVRIFHTYHDHLADLAHQHEAHAAAIKLQHHSLDSSRLHEHAATLEQENVRLAHELDTLRAHPELPHHPAVAQAQELSLALRRVSDKIALTEDALLQRTSELIDARSELFKSKRVADGAYALAARMRAREEASKARERELKFKAHASEEERKMVDLVVQEYADLVRNLEGRKSANLTPSVQNGSASSVTLVDNLQDGKSTLHRMLTAFSTESEQLHATIAQLNANVSDLQMTLDAQHTTASHDRMLLSQAKTELDKLNLEDQTAAKMVARYMYALASMSPRLLTYPRRKFSQASTNALQQQITTLKTRHAATINTLELKLSISESQLASEHARTTRLQDALDELCEDLARESYGRRREVALRLALLSREEGITESMRRWARRARESYARCYNSTRPSAPHLSSEDAVQEAFHRVVSDAESLLSTLDDDVQLSDATRTSGSLARITLARESVETLRNELQDELQKRIEAVRKTAFFHPNGHLDGTASELEEPLQPKAALPQDGDSALDHLLLTPIGNAGPEHKVAPAELPLPQDTALSVSVVSVPGESVDDPFVVPTAVISPIAELTEQTTVQETHSLPPPSLQGSTSTLATLLVDEEPKALQPHSPAVSMLDLRQDPEFLTGEPLATNEVSSHVSPDVTSSPPETHDDVQVLTEDNTHLLSTPAVSHDPPSNDSPTMLSELGATKHRYDALQHAFRDCSLALKELKRTLASSSPSPHARTEFYQYLKTALARIDDYTEDARVELEIRVADEELTVHGFETVLSVPGAFTDADERAEVETNAKAFVDGTDEGVAGALDKFGKKLEDVQHDVAVVKRTLHELAMSDDKDVGETVDGGRDAESGAGSGWTAWTAGLLGANTTPSRSPTPAQTFGAVMTSPRLRHAASLKQLRVQPSTDEGPEGPLAGLNLRIPMPSPSHAHLRYGQLGLGFATQGGPRTISTIYALGGLRSSSVGLGVGLGGSPSPARTGMQGMGGRLEGGVGWGGERSGNDRVEGHDLGGVE